MSTLRETLAEAEQNHTAVGHFNASDLVTLRAVFETARGLNLPVLAGVSEGEREFMGVRQVAAVVQSIRNEFGYPIFLDADHTHTLAKAVEAATAGFDAIVFDNSTLPFAENVEHTRKAVEAVKSINPAILVEGEIGDIGSGSEIHEKAPERALSTPDEARQFVEATGVDILAPAVGNMHGMLRSMVRGEGEKRLDIQRIQEIKQAARVFLTLHGGSGTNDEDLRSAIQAGVTIVHVNTELRLAWRRGLEEALASQPDEVPPYKILPGVFDAVSQVVRGRLEVFSARRAGAGG
ncbi:MAG TPA: class II fructose-bisphosphate aldolase [Bryobacteraceae bacterium]|nr:class II fructose-bisphosphate aldolase [Bryobacteraceae bacterium]